jgi:diaminopimelate decarboxylase
MPASQPLTGIRENSFAGLAKTFGTPLYIYDGDRIVSQIQKLRTAFSRMEVKIKFAAKALTNISVLKLMRRQGIGVDVVSLQEVQIARKAGFTPDQIMFTPSGVDFEEIAAAVAIGVNINLDNLSILEKFGQQYGATYPCGLRLNPHIMAGGNLKISTGHAHSKFGISVQQIADIHRIREKYQVKIRSLHIHTGSEITETTVFAKMATLLFELAEQFPDLLFLDFGGGFKVAYKEGDKVSDIDGIGAALAPLFEGFHKKHGRKLELWIEPGKYLVSECGYLLVKVNVVKPTPTITFVGVNSGLNHLIRPMMYDAYHEIVNVSNSQGALKTYNVVGNICETDTLGADRQLPEVREGDLLVLCNAGAYGYSMASNYNSRLRPAEVLVTGSEARLIRERDTLEQILTGQIDIFP